MSATREHRNAALIEELVNAALDELEEANDTYHELSAALPDDFPVLLEEFYAALTTLRTLAKLVSE